MFHDVAGVKTSESPERDLELGGLPTRRNISIKDLYGAQSRSSKHVFGDLNMR